ncbi:MAG: phage tail protein [Pseudomonadota bacterium]
MATLVLTVAGGAIGGPIGAAIGASLGNAIDRQLLFVPKGREGPRLSELAVQTSSYGTQIPRLFGTIRVAGSVIWATDLVEHRSTSGGKGRPTTTSYSYTASFAVAISARPVVTVRRIWADGALLRGAAGDLKVLTGYRLHTGGEDQPVDPLIAAAEGIAQTPAHRGIAYAVFEDMDLAGFGNRIPSLTFEVVADEAPVRVGAIAEQLGEGRVRAVDATTALLGFSAHGATLAAVLDTLAGATGGWFAPGDGAMLLHAGDGMAAAVADRGVRAAGGEDARRQRAIAAADSVPRMLTLRHYDVARDYQAGVQRAERPGAGAQEARLELPAVLSAQDAKAIAEASLARFDVERARRTVRLGNEGVAIVPGGRLRIGPGAETWRVVRASFERGVVALECVALAPAPLPQAAASGRAVTAPDLHLGETVLAAFELPPIDDTPATVLQLAVAAAGTGAGWRSAALATSYDGGGQWNDLGAAAAPAVMGYVEIPPGHAPAQIEDRVNDLVVTLANAEMSLRDADRDALDRGANLAMVGNELLQFGYAVSLGGNAWRLSRLWRGRRGTEAAIVVHAWREPFVLIERESLGVFAQPGVAPGSSVNVSALGAGDAAAVEVQARLDGVSILPLSPAHLRAQPAGDAGMRLNWVRRSRAGWRWLDGVDAPLSEEREAYRVAAQSAAGLWEQEVGEPTVLVPAHLFAAPCTVSIRQVGAAGLSAPATILVPSMGESL